LFAYRTLVSRPEIPLWRKRAIKGIAYHAHLYTRIAAGQETDEIEKWLDREFEAPAEEALQRATSDERLTSKHWTQLVRFLAAQDVRTPARLIENLSRWRRDAQHLLDSTLRESVKKIAAAKTSEEPNVISGNNSEYIPLHVTAEASPHLGSGKLRAHLVVGRGLWLFSIKHLLTKTISVLHQHRWSILSPPDDLRWFTSDDPVIRLNYCGENKYDFRGGWGSRRSEILLPLGPRHLLYTHIGERPPPRGEVLTPAKAVAIRRIIAEHAHRMILAASPHEDMPLLRPRVVNDQLFRQDQEQWRKWHEDQATAERKLASPAGGKATEDRSG